MYYWPPQGGRTINFQHIFQPLVGPTSPVYSPQYFVVPTPTYAPPVYQGGPGKL